MNTLILINPHLCCFSCAEGTIPTDYEQATGIEKKEIDARVAGHEDPFSMKVHQIPWGTKSQPTLVPSMYSERLVGVISKSFAHIAYSKSS